MAIYDVEIYFCASYMLLLAIDSEILFLRPFPIPRSKSTIHEMMESNVDQIPYCSLPKYLSIIGTSKKDAKMVKALNTKEPLTCFR